ncbi:MAG: hypothetical protein COU08_02160 [Candidatus Harrisonbacteria bacterium CG10_big_fil_rev_8_21_14_0_10_42_17]|uniref:Uncharacterized protein n=1 Tax=Candidatus Harrisonbacteria bacterium CG10_big_fil_rev_8_21_14_0_10_42_17 TaxID=1974584 RepID=A0A2M6WI69_9BACT|nr:MAG: hypothetical protein COU08_02160 [Candidatus Harrisonbacteria bacterium CG10_big_fil_rev_8_21_14_0_10_42_17]
MSKDFSGVHWASEIRKKGWHNALLDRLKFHKTITLALVVECSGRGESVCRCHFRHLVDSGVARWSQTLEDAITLP